MSSVCVESYLVVFVKKVLENQEFLSFVDKDGKEWVCVFDFIEGDYYADFFKGIFHEFGITAEKVHLKEAEAMFRGSIETQEQYDLSIARDWEIKEFNMKGLNGLERMALEDGYIKGLNSLYMEKENFDIAKSAVLEEFLGEDVEYLKLSFDVNNSLLINGNRVLPIAPLNKRTGLKPTYTALLLKYFFSGYNRASENWIVLSDKIMTSSSEDFDHKNPRKALSDAIRPLNSDCEKRFGFPCLSFVGEEVVNLTI